MKKNILKYTLHAVILAGVVFAGVKYLNGDEVLEAVKNFDYIYAPGMLVLAASYILVKGWRFAWLMSPLSRMSWYVFLKAYLAGTAATLIPGGVATRSGLMSQAGVPVAQSSAPVAYSSLLDQAVFISAAITAFFQALLGAFVYFFFWKGEMEKSLSTRKAE